VFAVEPTGEDVAGLRVCFQLYFLSFFEFEAVDFTSGAAADSRGG